MTLKGKRLQILSLAIDINTKYGAVCFVEYKPHTDAIYIQLFNEPWYAFAECKEYISYNRDAFAGKSNVLSHDEMINMLRDILKNGLNK